MKAAAFDYVRATSVAHALDVLAERGDDVRLLAGGQSLVPALNLRLSAPGLLLDIGGLEELRGITIRDGVLRLGALVRHVELENSPLIAEHAPLLAQAAVHIAHAAIRNRGTIGGSLANADPAAELPACVLALGARIVVTGQGGTIRRIAAEDFFQGVYATALHPDEILTGVEIDARPGGQSAFGEFVRRRGDYALVGLAMQARMEGGTLRDSRLAWFGVGDRPVLSPATAAALAGRRPDTASVALAQEKLSAELDPRGDIHAAAGTRLQLARVLLARALATLH